MVAQKSLGTTIHTMKTTAMNNQQKPLSELIQKLHVSSIVIRNLPEMPGYNGSMLTIGDTEANEISNSIDAAVDGFKARLAELQARIAELEQQLEEARKDARRATQRVNDYFDDDCK